MKIHNFILLSIIILFLLIPNTLSKVYSQSEEYAIDDNLNVIHKTTIDSFNESLNECNLLVGGARSYDSYLQNITPLSIDISVNHQKLDFLDSTNFFSLQNSLNNKYTLINPCTLNFPKDKNQSIKLRNDCRNLQFSDTSILIIGNKNEFCHFEVLVGPYKNINENFFKTPFLPLGESNLSIVRINLPKNVKITNISPNSYTVKENSIEWVIKNPKGYTYQFEVYFKKPIFTKIKDFLDKPWVFVILTILSLFGIWEIIGWLKKLWKYLNPNKKRKNKKK